jgi:mono/diheme cytochrome c family protein
MSRRQSITKAIAACAAALVLTFAGASGGRVGAQGTTPDASDLAEGRRLYQQKANCQACHGWSGDGHKTDNQMPDGANLRETKLPRAGLVMTIKCGRLNSQMPAFDKFAYSDGRCYGKTQADLKSYPRECRIHPPRCNSARSISSSTS